jgi:stearoyl-CoA desaturase (delta-9 desaturase)
VPWFKIQRALLDTQFRRAKLELARQVVGSPRLDELRRRVAEEYESFCNAVATWTDLREQSVADAKRALVDRWEKSSLPSRLKALERGLQLQYRRMRLLGAQLSTAQP